MVGRTEDEISTCIFYDRLRTFHRKKKDGTWVSRGGEIDSMGKVVLRIYKGSIGSFMTAHLGAHLVLRANIRDPLIETSTLHATAIASLVDWSTTATNFRRSFKFCFFDNRSIQDFQTVYNRALDEYLQEVEFEDEDEDEDKEVDGAGEEEVEKDSDDKVEVADNEEEEHDDGIHKENPNDELIDSFEDFGFSQDMFEPARHFKNGWPP